MTIPRDQKIIMNNPFLKISVGFYAKNLPKNHVGLSNESWVFGKKPLPFHTLMAAFIRAALDFYLTFTILTVDELNNELRQLEEIIKNTELEYVDK